MMSIRHSELPVDIGPRPPVSGAISGAPEGVLDAARDSILAVGWRRTTLTDVAKRAGVSRMTIYRHWADMTALLADLLVREWRELLTTTPIAGADQVSASSLADDVSAVVSALREDPLFARILDVDPELLLPYVLQRRGRNQELLLGLLSDAVGAGQARGAVRQGDPELLARSVLLCAQGFLLSAGTMTDPDITQAALDDELRHLLERHLRP